MRTFPNTRLRRLRSAKFSRDLLCENHLNICDLIYPLFVVEGQKQRQKIQTLPGIERLSIDFLIEEAQLAQDLGIPAVILFPLIEPSKKNNFPTEAFEPQGLIPRAIRALKKACPQLGVIADIALDPYTSHGQDGIINEQGYVLNDETIALLIRQALCLAEAGVDVVAPSDMMDGRVGSIRNALEENGYINTQILAYGAKYASHLYTPFREAVGSSVYLGKADKRTYQMDPANSDEAIHEAALDIKEGADIILVKPGLFYLDVLYRLKKEFQMPTFAYQVSGEYNMIMAGISQGLPETIIWESLIAFKRAGADAILTYFAKYMAQNLQNGI